MITPNPLLGTLLHAMGGLCAAIFYTPNHKTKKWSWETYWLTQACFAWFVMPIVGAMITVPDYAQVLSEAPRSAMIKSFLFGTAYGIGGTTFGMALRYVGYSLTYSIAVGISSILGTLLPPLLSGKLLELVHKPGGLVVLGGVVLGAMGIGLCGYSGLQKERGMDSGRMKLTGFSLVKGLPLCFIAGFLSAVFNFALLAGQPIADIAAKHGAGYLMGNAIYPFAMGGAFLSTAIYCLILGGKNRSLGEYRAIGKAFQSALPINYILAAIGGSLWYFQFFFYGLGHVRMGSYQFSSWAIHMVLLIFFSNLTGILMKEWKECNLRTKISIGIALVVLIAAVLTIGYGNYLGDAAAHT
ncbi:MAG: rhamnose:proton symporter [Armatimonadetes bacterium]|nr:rhamnose:proton symporter [Armatimonadota bacterium]